MTTYPTLMESTEQYINRLLPLKSMAAQKSHFVLGPRQTGKTSLLRAIFPDALYFDLLDSDTYLSLSQHPGRLEEALRPSDRLVIIDEIQRLPVLLHEVHRLIEKKKVRFVLSGSSARKLRRGGVNLLGGRARTVYLHPFTRRELGAAFDLKRALHSGLVPSIYFSPNPDADLAAYNGDYLQQEIIAEAATRNVPAFSRFLGVAAFCNGSVVNYSNVANDAQVPRTTVYEYFEILKDTLIIHEVPAWRKTTKRKPLVSSKFYFFDIGVVSSLQRRRVSEGSTEFGTAFETYIAHELRAHRDYCSNESLTFWKSVSGHEVDFIIDDHTAVEVKAKRSVGPQDLKALSLIAEERKLKRYICVCLESQRRSVGKIEVLPYGEFLDALWDDEYTM